MTGALARLVEDVETMGREARHRRDGTQQLTRIPPYRPGDWVRLRAWPVRDELRSEREGLASLSGKVRRVKSLTCSITCASQETAVWRVHLEPCGRCVEWHMVERLATPEEIAAEERRQAHR